MNINHEPSWLQEYRQRHPDSPEIPEWLLDLVSRYRDRPGTDELTVKMRAAVDAGFTQRQLAQLIGSPQQSINRWIHPRS